MTGRERILAAVRHEEGDRVPVSPRVHAWLYGEYGDERLETLLEHLPEMDPMHCVPSPTPNYLDGFPDDAGDYDLPDVTVEQRKRREGAFTVVERTFHTPAGDLSDATRIPPPNGEYGLLPNPVRKRHLLEEPDHLERLPFLFPPVRREHPELHRARELMGDRGVVLAWVHSALDHMAGIARSMTELMIDYYVHRPFFEELLALCHRRSLEELGAALEAGAEAVFGSWYFNSLSAGWSPAIFREVFLPQLRDHVALTHRYGALYDYYDDGRLAGTMEMIADAGVDVLETCTPPPVGDFDLEHAKGTIGDRTTLKGYVDLLYVVRQGTPELIDRTVRRAMEAAKRGGGFIIGSSDSFRDGTPPENIRAYFRACLEYGRYGA